MSIDAAHPQGLLLSVLRRSSLCAGLQPDEIEQVALGVRLVSYSSGEIIFRHDEHGDRMFLVAAGRVKLSLEQGGKQLGLLEYVGRGHHFGELAVLTDGRHTATAVAVMDCELLELDQANFQRLMLSVPGFAANLSKSLGFRLRGQADGGRRRRRRPKVVGLVNSSIRTQGVLRRLAQVLVREGLTLEVLTDRPDPLPASAEFMIERIPAGLSEAERPAALRQRLNQVIEHHDQVLVDLSPRGSAQLLPALLQQCEDVLWLIDCQYLDTTRRQLVNLLDNHPRLAGRLRVVWVTEGEELFSPKPMEDLGLDGPDFKLPLEGQSLDAQRRERMALSRLARHLQGICLGLALGGGGARGLAHLGVLRGLEQAGFDFDLVAGTSSGALMGLSYCGGWAPDGALREFNQALTPPRWVRSLPGGPHWYLWTMFRSGGWDRKLRPYVGRHDLDQLQIPLYTVACDLVRGKQVVRSSCDAVDAVLESINLPPIARPILRQGMALIDGGAVNNIPADVLPGRGADLIVAVDVVARLQQQFARNTPETPLDQMRRPGTIETLFRVSEVQDYRVSVLQTGAVDLLITPETSNFEFADFTQGYPLGDAGEAAAQEVVPQLRQMIADLKRTT